MITYLVSPIYVAIPSFRLPFQTAIAVAYRHCGLLLKAFRVRANVSHDGIRRGHLGLPGQATKLPSPGPIP